MQLPTHTMYTTAFSNWVLRSANSVTGLVWLTKNVHDTGSSKTNTTSEDKLKAHTSKHKVITLLPNLLVLILIKIILEIRC